MSRKSAVLRVSPVVLLMLAAGCTPAVVLPKTYPASGSVAYKGGQPMTGGSVHFVSADDPLLRVMGTIGQDGSFTLTTVKDTAKADGAPEGTYRVLVQPPMVSDARDKVPDGHKAMIPTELPRTYKLEARENTGIKIELPMGRPHS
jgi:hypothetical protein